MKNGWSLVIAAGFLAAAVRLAGFASMADLTAFGYLLLATLVFERGRRIEAARIRLTARMRDSRNG
jgi:hypothetical protein